jgi:acylphosphatase
MTLRIGSTHERVRFWDPAVTGTQEARLKATVTGRVQGVGYRYFVLAEAERLSLGGSVRNMPNGAVAVEAEGSQPKLLDLLERLRQGPPAARVERVDVDWLSPHGQTQFIILSG